MPAPIVYEYDPNLEVENLEEIPMNAEGVDFLRIVYRKAEGSQAFKGTLWERIAERATLGA